MVFPPKIPGLKLLLGLWVVYTAVWISLEGALGQVVIMGVATAVLLMGLALVKNWFAPVLARE